VRSPDRIVSIFARQGEARLLNISYPTFEDLRRRHDAFSDLAAVTEGPVSLSDGEPVVIWAAHVSENYFDMLGVTSAAGRVLHPDDVGAPRVVLSHALWTTHFGGDRTAVGRTIRINGAAFTVVGIAPAQFTGTRLFTYEPAMWLPVSMHRGTIPSSAGLLTD